MSKSENHAPSAKEKHRKSKPSLPNGERPNFGPEDLKREPSGGKGKPSGMQKKGKKSNNTASNKKGNESTKRNNNHHTTNVPSINHTSKENLNQAFSAREAGKKSGEESYAGSSFHSSPEALALPKPSFKSSPKQQSHALDHQSPIQSAQQSVSHHTGIGNTHMGTNLHPGFVYQGMPAAPPPQYPVVAYPAPTPYHPGFDYRAVPQGYANYPYLPSGISHVPQQQFVAPPQAHTLNQQFALGGQRISFNDLMNSSK